MEDIKGQLELGKSIRRARLEGRLTQVELDAKVGCSRNHLLSLETGKHKPSLEL